ncbi:transposase [Streptomyces sp. NBC_00081]|uniref:transposase n=1 Tax=Streptomyces sp. NBC_00081 TaxID=2975646 RepID=UPI00386E0195
MCCRSRSAGMAPWAVDAGNSCHAPSEPRARRYAWCGVCTTSSVYCSVLSVVHPVRSPLGVDPSDHQLTAFRPGPRDGSQHRRWCATPCRCRPDWRTGAGWAAGGYCHRQMLDAVFYVTDNEIKWRSMPVDFPAWDRVYTFFRRWRK